jgi:galactitol-specific phosphotransferase system IIB component
MSRLIVIACGAGVNTSSLAVAMIDERLLKEGIMDVKVQKCLIQEIDRFQGRMTLVVLMMKAYVEFDCPVMKGLPFLIGTHAEQEQLLQEIVDFMNKDAQAKKTKK